MKESFRKWLQTKESSFLVCKARRASVSLPMRMAWLCLEYKGKWLHWQKGLEVTGASAIIRPAYFKTKCLLEAMGWKKVTCSSCVTQVRYCFYSQKANIVQIKSSVSWLSLVLLLTVNRHLWRNIMHAVTLLPEGGKFGRKVDFCLISFLYWLFFPNFFFF